MLRVLWRKHLADRTAMARGRPRPSWLLAAAVCVLATIANTSSAAIVVSSGNNPEPNEEIILLGNGSLEPVMGVTNTTNVDVIFTSDELNLFDPSGGQARIEALASADVNADQVAISGPITIAIEDGFEFFDLIFNAFIGGGLGDADGSLTVSANGTEIGSNLALSSGENFYTIVADPSTPMTSVTIDLVTGSYADLRQVRISGVQPADTPVPGVIPEPASMAAWSLLALCAVGACGFRRRVVRC